MSSHTDSRDTESRGSEFSTSNSISGYNIRARLSQQAGQVGTREYWSSWKASAKQKAADIRQWAEGESVEAITTPQSPTSPITPASYRPRNRVRAISSPTLSPKLGFSTSTLAAHTPASNTHKEEVFPVLLPGYTFTRTGEGDGEELIVTLRGFIARKPSIHGRAQRMFNLMAKQLARLPKPLSASSTSLLLHPNSSSIDDAHFFPSIPQGSVSSSPSGLSTPVEEQYQKQHLSEKLVEGITEHMNEETLGKLVSKLGALPIDGAGDVHAEGQDRPAEREPDLANAAQGQRPLASTNTGESVGVAPDSSGTSKMQDRNSELPRSRTAASTTQYDSPSTTSLASTATSSTTTDSVSSGPSIGPSRLAKLKKLTPSRTASSSSLLALSKISTSSADSQLVGGSQAWASRTLDEIHQLTTNLNERLADFWVYRVAFRRVRVEVQGRFVESESQSGDFWQTLLAQELKSDLNGMFRLRVNLGPLGVFEDRLIGLRTRAVLLEDSPPSTTHAALEAVASPPPSTEWCPLNLARSTSSQTSIRLVSDVDDTIRQTGVVQGLKSVFRQVFVLPHSEVIVPGMADWYHSLAQKHDVGLHFVSNAPIELWKPIKEFLDSAGMPSGHLHLKSYNSEIEGSTSTANAHHQEGRDESDGGPVQSSSINSGAAKSSLLSNWLQPASARKRAAIVSILDDFPEAKFLLVGDTGELDLELYSELAKERPNQIKALYLRDVTSEAYSGPTSGREDASAEDEKWGRLAAARSAGDAIKRPVRAFTDTPRNSSRTTSPTTTRAVERGRDAKSSRFPPSTLSSPVSTTSRPPPPPPPPSTIISSKPTTPTERTLSTPRRADSQVSTVSSQTVTLPSSIPAPAAAARPSRRSPILQARINKALAILPADVEIHFFKEGGDVKGACERLVIQMRKGEEKGSGS